MGGLQHGTTTGIFVSVLIKRKKDMGYSQKHGALLVKKIIVRRLISI